MKIPLISLIFVSLATASFAKSNCNDGFVVSGDGCTPCQAQTWRSTNETDCQACSDSEICFQGQRAQCADQTFVQINVTDTLNVPECTACQDADIRSSCAASQSTTSNSSNHTSYHVIVGGVALIGCAAAVLIFGARSRIARRRSLILKLENEMEEPQNRQVIFKLCDSNATSQMATPAMGNSLQSSAFDINRPKRQREFSTMLKQNGYSWQQKYFDNGEDGDLGLQTLEGTVTQKPKKILIKREAALRFFRHEHVVDDENLSDYEEIEF